ncbi:thiamine pyrophosphate-dependent enzyme [Micromonospora sp. NPDC050980]|uniref:thiamine pyrophosphate-dependent enzyme n=1 Tax=Micromonospora sp. NPDC050980 TaxID=3155161 RepID=UPI0033D189ED
MNKTSAIATVIAATDREPVIFTTGYACRIAAGLHDRPNHFYMTGSMGLASSIAVGVALEARRRTVVVDGDGALLMNPVGLIAAGSVPGLPLVHVVLDDGCYASTGGQAVPSHHVDLCAWARAAGYARTVDTSCPEQFADKLRAALADADAPVFIRAALTEPDAPVPGRIDPELPEHARRFRDHLARLG